MGSAPHLLYPFICWWTSRLLPWPGYCKYCWNEHWGICVLESWFSQGICPVLPSNRIAVSYGRFIPSFLRNLHTVFHNGCNNLYSHQHHRRVLFSPHPLQYLLLVDFWITAFLTSVKWCFIVVLICISLIMSDVGFKLFYFNIKIDLQLFSSLLSVLLFTFDSNS